MMIIVTWNDGTKSKYRVKEETLDEIAAGMLRGDTRFTFFDKPNKLWIVNTNQARTVRFEKR